MKCDVVRVEMMMMTMMKWSEMNPLEWRKFINHEVCVTVCDEQRFEGSVFTVDPVSAR